MLMCKHTNSKIEPKEQKSEKINLRLLRLEDDINCCINSCQKIKLIMHIIDGAVDKMDTEINQSDSCELENS